MDIFGFIGSGLYDMLTGWFIIFHSNNVVSHTLLYATMQIEVHYWLKRLGASNAASIEPEVQREVSTNERLFFDDYDEWKRQWEAEHGKMGVFVRLAIYLGIPPAL